ncbi:MAG: glycosyltransferase family 2 protein [Candidatus Omnitrophica bacterium]|nr:glycosyltransferase family 2 protein [Candidatus Omnitrophota bacterium]
MNFPLISIIIINYNGKDLLKRFLPSILNLNYPNYEVILVDNASTDGSIEFLKNNYPKFKIIRVDKNYGTAEGGNIGARYAKGEYLFFISNDMELDKYILNYMIERMDEDKCIGICTCKMKRINESGEKINIIDSVGADLDISGFPSARGINQIDYGQYDYFTEVFFSFGGAMLIRKKIFDRIGGYDSLFFTLADDIDLSWRVRLLGYKVMVEPKAFLYHQSSATLGLKLRRSQKRFLSERNTLRMLLKNYSLTYLSFILPLYLIIFFAEICFFIVVGRFGIAKNVFNSLIWNIKNLKTTLLKRKDIQKVRKIKDRDIFILMLKRSEKIRMFWDYLKNPNAKHWERYFR